MLMKLISIFINLIGYPLLTSAIVCYNTEAASNTGRSVFVGCYEEGVEAYCYSKTTSNGTLSSGCVTPLQPGPSPQGALALQCRQMVKQSGTGACTETNGTKTCCCIDGRHCGAERFRLRPQVQCQVNELITGDLPSSEWCLGHYCYRYNRQTGCFPSDPKHQRYWLDRTQIPADHFKCPIGGGCIKLPENAGHFCCCRDPDGCEAMQKEFLQKNPPDV